MKKFLAVIWEIIINMVIAPLFNITALFFRQLIKFVATVLPWVLLLTALVWIIG